MSRVTGIGAFMIGVCVTCVITGTLLFVGVMYQDSAYRDSIYPRVTIDGIPFTGKTQEEAALYFSDLNRRLSTVQLEIYYADAPVATYSGEMLGLRSNGTQLVDQAYLVGRSGSALDRFVEKFGLLTRIRRHAFTSHVSYTLDPIEETVLILKKQYEIVPQNALFEIKDGKVTAFSQEHDGIAVEDERAIEKARILLSKEAVLDSTRSSKPLRLIVSSRVLKPEITLSKANTYGIEEVIGVGTSDYSGSIPGRVHNVLLASKRLHGTLIPPGEEFSFNKALGEVSSQTGYQAAYVILNGRTQLGDGGGVCQTSTTMFRAAIASGLPITVWAPHAYRVHYYENDGKPGRDATVYSPSQDLRFRNDTPAAILIQTEANTDANILTYTFWGKKDARQISISDVSMGSSVPAPPAREEEDPTLPRGERRQVDWAADGLTTWFDYRVVRGQELIQEKRFTSNYRPWQAVYLVGTKE